MIEVKVDTAKLDRLIAELPEVRFAIVRAMALAVRDEAVRLAPVDTGALKRSARIWVGYRDGRPAAGVRFGDEQVDYAVVVHYRSGPGREFLRRPAMNASRLQKVAADAARKALADILG